jgi:hypothetical protein
MQGTEQEASGGETITSHRNINHSHHLLDGHAPQMQTNTLKSVADVNIWDLDHNTLESNLEVLYNAHPMHPILGTFLDNDVERKARLKINQM